MIDKKDIEFDNDGRIIVKGVALPLTRENLFDYEAQTGMDAIEMIEFTYNNCLSVVRERKIDEILN